MRLSVVSLALLACGSLSLARSLPPLTVKDISLMLRSGYSADAVEREVATRHFIETVDATAEENLTRAGACSVPLPTRSR